MEFKVGYMVIAPTTEPVKQLHVPRKVKFG
jgi:hypothetical protein